MAMTINPAVRSISYRRWAFHVIAFVLGVMAGAAITYFAASGVFHALHGAVPVLFVGLAIGAVGLCVLRDLGAPVPVPYPRRRQVPEWVRRTLPGGATAAFYGAELGTGFLTRYTYATHVAFVLLLATQSSPAIVFAGIGVFGLGKTIVVVAGFGGRTYAEYDRRIQLRHRRRGGATLRRVNAAVAMAALAILITNL